MIPHPLLGSMDPPTSLADSADAYSSLYTHLPVVVINDWSEVTTDFLEEQWDAIAKRAERGEYNLRTAMLPYWLSRLFSHTLNKKQKHWTPSSVASL